MNARLAALADALEKSADEVLNFPHPTHCDFLHLAYQRMTESVAILRALAEQEPQGWLRVTLNGEVRLTQRHPREDFGDRVSPLYTLPKEATDALSFYKWAEK